MSILDLVLQQLREEELDAAVAYPGQKYPRLTGPMAAVHIQKVDRASQTVTVEVNMICPAAMGGTACEEKALHTTEALRRGGAQCIQNGCSYDGASQVYTVPILATYTCITDVDACVIGMAFQVFLNGAKQTHAVRFCGTEAREYRNEYAMGESAPADILPDAKRWEIELEEMIPVNSPILPEPAEIFELKVYTLDKVETYSSCRWTYVQRQHSREGLRRIRRGFALGREEV